MMRPVLSLVLIVALASLSGCRQDSATVASQPEQPASPAPRQLSIALDSSDYRGGDDQQHWHLTRWSLRNDSSEPIAEAVVVITLFDADANFLGHHAVTFQHLFPGETARQQRLFLLKSDNIGQWRPRCESVRSRNRGDLTGGFRVTFAGAGRQS